MSNKDSDQHVLQQIGARIHQYRLNRNMTQASLAEEAGISKSTIERLEDGRSVQLQKLIRVLRVLDLVDNLDTLIPEPAVSPLQQLNLSGRSRKRASSSKSKTSDDEWSWGDDK